VYYDCKCCRKNASTGLHCCILLPLCLLVSSSTESPLTEVFAIGSVLSAVAVGSWTVIHNVSFRLFFAATVFYVVACLIGMCHSAAVGSGNYRFFC